MSEAHEVAEAIEMIRESAGGIAVRGDLARIRSLRFTTPGFDRDTWRALSELGWLGLRLPEQVGGVGLGMSACCALLEELGGALLPEPVIGAMLAVQVVGSEQLSAVLAGEKIVLAAWQEHPRALDAGVSTKLRDGHVTGMKRHVAMAEGADAFAVATDNGWALVQRDAPGLELEVLSTQDGGHYGTLHLRDVEAQSVSSAGLAGPLAEAALASAAYMLGMIDEALHRTLDYLRTRVQFGKTIGSFQALQHRMVDLKLEAALTRASVAEAARQWDRAPGTRGAQAAVSRAKARASATVMLVTRQVIQLHGGIGFTDEHDIGLFLRKAMVLAPAYGDAAAHRKRFAELDTDELGAAT